MFVKTSTISKKRVRFPWGRIEEWIADRKKSFKQQRVNISIWPQLDIAKLNFVTVNRDGQIEVIIYDIYKYASSE